MVVLKKNTTLKNWIKRCDGKTACNFDSKIGRKNHYIPFIFPKSSRIFFPVFSLIRFWILLRKRNLCLDWNKNLINFFESVNMKKKKYTREILPFQSLRNYWDVCFLNCLLCASLVDLLWASLSGELLQEMLESEFSHHSDTRCGRIVWKS